MGASLVLLKSSSDSIRADSDLSKSGYGKNSAAMTRRGALAALSYMACAVLLVMFNKAALSSFKFPCTNVITLFQMISSSLLLYVMRYWSFVSFMVDDSLDPNPDKSFMFLPYGILVQAIPLAFAYLLYMVVSMESVRGINLPMYTTLRRTTVAITMIVEYFLIGQKHSLIVVSSVWIIVLGAVIAGVRDLSFDSAAYAVVLFSNICTAVYLALIARIGKSSGLSSFGLMWCNGIICGPILLLWTYIRGDLAQTMEFAHLSSLDFQAVMLLSCAMAFLLNYTVFLNTTLNSPLTQTICGNLKDLFIIGVGWQLFGGLPFDLLNVAGQLVGFLGSCMYAYCKIKGK